MTNKNRSHSKSDVWQVISKKISSDISEVLGWLIVKVLFATDIIVVVVVVFEVVGVAARGPPRSTLALAVQRRVDVAVVVVVALRASSCRVTSRRRTIAASGFRWPRVLPRIGIFEWIKIALNFAVLLVLGKPSAAREHAHDVGLRVSHFDAVEQPCLREYDTCFNAITNDN